MPDCRNDTSVLLRRAGAGDRQAWGELLTRQSQRLRRMIDLRMDRRLRVRLDPSDVLQEACLEASQRLDEYLCGRSMSFYVWLRFLVAQKLVTLHRHHFGTQKRDPNREISLFHGVSPQASTASLAAQLMGRGGTPSQAAMRAERLAQLEEALARLSHLDREVLALRHFEHLSNTEAAQVLGVPESTASTRYLRALKRLRQHIGDASDDLGL